MDVYFSDQVNDPSLRLFSSTKTLKETIDDSVFEDDPIIVSAIAAATSGASMDIDELMKRQKQRSHERKFCDFKYELKPMMIQNDKFNNDVGVQLSKITNDVSVQQQQQQQRHYKQAKIKEELLRQHEQKEPEDITKLSRHHVCQPQSQPSQKPSPNIYNQQSPPIKQRMSPNIHHLQQRPPPPNLHTALKNQQHLFRQQQHQLYSEHRKQLQSAYAQHPPLQTLAQKSTDAKIPFPIKKHPPESQQQQSHSQNSQYSDPNTIDQYLLSWNNFHGNMCRGFHTLQKDEKMVDVTIAAGGKIFKAHKLVLSVCSSYFQQIFLENPSSHPILLMADVEASHMAGLLDFMYSGQVNVKYEDLPIFLKVAETMKIKGLHTEKNDDDESKSETSTLTAGKESAECRLDSDTHSVNITGQSFVGHPLMEHRPQNEKMEGHQDLNINGDAKERENNNNENTGYNHKPGIRDRIQSKTTQAEIYIKNISQNNNNNSKSNYNYTESSPHETTALDENYGDLLQSSSSNKKIFDSARKQHKYLAKRKILMHYSEIQNEKRLKKMEESSYSDLTDVPIDECSNAVETVLPVQPNQQQQQGQRQQTIQKQSQQQPHQQSNSNSFQIYLMEGHQPCKNMNNKSINNNTSNRDKNKTSNQDEEEALNLVQSSSTNVYHSETRTKKNNDMTLSSQDDISVETPYTTISEEIAKTIIKHEIFDDNNNRDTETDTNNNDKTTTSAVLLNDFQTTSNEAEVRMVHQKHKDKSQNDSDGVVQKVINTDNNSDKNNNNQTQLDLSCSHTINNIATAEILCDLKSTVFQIENGQQNCAGKSCPKIGEIRSAD